MSREQQIIVLFLVLVFFISAGIQRNFPTLNSSTGRSSDWNFPFHREGGRIAVEIDGEVPKRGLYAFEPGIRVEEALRQAGGICEGAYAQPKDLKREIHQSSRILIQSSRPGEVQILVAPLEGMKRRILGIPINLNVATIEDLDTLPGVGPQIAKAIVDHRQRWGPFQSVEDLIQIPGIGPKKMATLRPYVSLQ